MIDLSTLDYGDYDYDSPAYAFLEPYSSYGDPVILRIYSDKARHDYEDLAGITNLSFNAFVDAKDLTEPITSNVTLNPLGIRAKNCVIGYCSISSDESDYWVELTDCGFEDDRNFYFNPIKRICVSNSEPYYIPANAFAGCNDVEEIILGEGLTTIYDYAFFGCGISRKDMSVPLIVTLPTTLEYIGAYAFQDMGKVYNISFRYYGDGIAYIDPWTFYIDDYRQCEIHVRADADIEDGAFGDAIIIRDL